MAKHPMGFSGSPCPLSFDYEAWAKSGIVRYEDWLRERQFSESGEKLIEINLSRLNPQKKQRAWAWIKNNDKPLADLLQGDPVFSQLTQIFNGEICVYIPSTAVDEIDRDLRASAQRQRHQR